MLRGSFVNAEITQSPAPSSNRVAHCDSPTRRKSRGDLAASGVNKPRDPSPQERTLHRVSLARFLKVCSVSLLPDAHPLILLALAGAVMALMLVTWRGLARRRRRGPRPQTPRAPSRNPAVYLPRLPRLARPRSERGPDAVLIDDDPIVHLTWGSAAQRHGIRLLALSSPHEFWAHLHRLRQDTTLYVDFELGGISARAFVEELLAHGFTRIYWASGHNPSRLPLMDRVQGAVDKVPPWRGGP